DFSPAPELQSLNEGQTDAARADHAEHRGGPQVDLEAVKHVGRELWEHLGHDREEERVELVPACGPDGLHRALIDALDDVGEHLAEVTDRVDAHRHDARRWPWA